MLVPNEYFPALSRYPQFPHAFVGRAVGVPMDCDRTEAMARLRPAHVQAVLGLGFSESRWWTAEQVHGAEIATVAGEGGHTVQGVDGLLTNSPGTLLGIYVADCGPVYLLDPVRRAIGLLHSGKLGSAGNITGRAVAAMQQQFGCEPKDLILQLGPCIRPPAYEIDITAQIIASAREAGLTEANIHDCGQCTSRDLTRYYSYRVEKGQTGRHVALLGMAQTVAT